MNDCPEDNGFGVALKAVIMHEGKFLILLRSRLSKGEAGYWELPGGRMMLGESFVSALKREVFEETGLKVTLLKPLTIFDAKRDIDTQVIGITFLCKLGNSPDRLKLSEEHLEAHWIKYEELNKYKIFNEMKKESEGWSF